MSSLGVTLEYRLKNAWCAEFNVAGSSVGAVLFQNPNKLSSSSGHPRRVILAKVKLDDTASHEP